MLGTGAATTIVNTGAGADDVLVQSFGGTLEIDGAAGSPFTLDDDAAGPVARQSVPPMGAEVPGGIHGAGSCRPHFFDHWYAPRGLLVQKRIGLEFFKARERPILASGRLLRECCRMRNR